MDANTGSSILALDVGAVRIGMALASTRIRFANPAGVLLNTPNVLNDLRVRCAEEGVSQLVIGLPRGLDGQETAQTTKVRSFGRQVEQELRLPVHWQDEAVTSVRAEEELRQRGKPYKKEDIDALSATYILEDYLRESV